MLAEFWSYEILRIEAFVLSPERIIKALVIYLLTKIAIRFVHKYIFSKERKYRLNISRKEASFMLTKYFIWVFSIMTILAIFGISGGIIATGGAALLVAYGLGIQQIFFDLTAGILLLFEGKVEVGDIVEVDKLIGRVKKITIRTSELITRDDIHIIVPNSKLIGDNVINWSHNQQLTRFYVEVGVSYKSDVNLVKEVLLTAVRDFDEIAVHPRPFVMFKDYGESQLSFGLYFWTDEVFRIELLMSKLRFKIWEQFKAFGIEVPYPQRDIHIKQADSKSGNIS